MLSGLQAGDGHSAGAVQGLRMRYLALRRTSARDVLENSAFSSCGGREDAAGLHSDRAITSWVNTYVKRYNVMLACEWSRAPCLLG